MGIRSIIILGVLGVGLGRPCMAQEQAKPEPSNPEQAQPEAPKPDQAKPDQPKPDQPPRKDPQADPGLSDPSLDDAITGHRKAGPSLAPIPPTPPKPGQRPVPSVPAPVIDAPGVAALDVGLPDRHFYPEGSLLPARQGQVMRARSGEMIFVPSAAGEGSRPEPAMVLLGCQRLSQLDSAAAAPGFTGSVVLSGQVFVYHERHYLLPTVYSVHGPADTDEAPVSGKKPEKGQPKTTPADPRAEDLIKELESQRSLPRTLDPAPTAPAPATSGREARSLIPEGTVIVMRRGRLIRQPGEEGRFAFAFDNDNNSPAPAPMLLLPCAELQKLEALVAGHGEDLAYKISGRVTTYQGRNYLLATMHQVLPAESVVPMQ
jgi:hypothetical protein